MGRKISDTILNLIYPRCCPLCHRVLPDQNMLLCSGCRHQLKPVSGIRCMKCGRPVEDAEQEYCSDCASYERVFTQGRGIFLYDPVWKYSMMRYKYFGCREYGEFYARSMAVFAAAELRRWRPELIVPVPLHKKKLKQRGFNQSLCLAQWLGKFTGIPVDDSLVTKIRNTKSQKKLDAAQRRKNLQNAFFVERSVKAGRILVVDDVFTTGSTMDAMAACLLEKGAVQVFFLTVCIVKR